MAANDRKVVVGVFTDRGQADRCVQELYKAGFTKDQIGIVGRDAHKGEVKHEGSYAGEGAAIGAAAGAGVGGLVGLGILSGIIPVIGPVIAGGTLAVILANAAGGAVIGGLLGSLTGLGIPEEEARYYEGEVKSGRMVVTVKCGNRCQEAETIMRRNGAYDFHQRTAAVGQHQQVAESSATCATTGQQKMQVREEELHVEKQPVKTGEVHVRKEVHTEHKTIDVPVQREEVVIERRPVAGQAASSGTLRAGEEIRIPVKEEQVKVEKQAVVKEEVSVSKQKVQSTERVSGTVRKEEVKVEEKGDVRVRHQDKGKKC